MDTCINTTITPTLLHLTGASEASYAVYEKCDLKHIQLDTMGHTLALQALDTANYTAAADIFSATLKFFMANYKDVCGPHFVYFLHQG